MRVLWGACDALATPRPLGPVFDMAPDLPSLDLNTPRHDVFTDLLDLLVQTRTLMVIEDVHWADEATLDLLIRLGRRIERTRALVVETYRADEVDRAHPLADVLGTRPRPQATSASNWTP